MDELTYEEMDIIKESVCDSCKGVFYTYETGCYEKCEIFQEELNELRTTS